MKLTSVKRIDSENARITLNVKSDWGKGDGGKATQKYAKVTTEKIDKNLTVFGNQLNQSFSNISMPM